MELPMCAQLNNRGTVIVRLKGTQVQCKDCCEADALRLQCDRKQPCVLCRLGLRPCSICSVCNCGPYDRWRSHRPKTTKNRFVKVCAAVCIILFVGSVSQVTAAPLHVGRDSKKMERTRGSQDNQPEYLWENPCDLISSSTEPRPNRKYEESQAKKAATQTRNTFVSTVEYKDQFAQTTNSYSSYESLIAMWDTYDWLKRVPWYSEEMFPRDISFSRHVTDEYLKTFIFKGSTKLDEVLPSMYRSLQTVVAALDSMVRNGLTEGYLAELKTKVELTKHNVRAVLCHFYDILISRNLPVENVKLKNEIPDFQKAPSEMILVYRDTLDYLDYLASVFQKMYDEKV